MSKYVKQGILFLCFMPICVLASPATTLTLESMDMHDLMIRHIFATAKTTEECNQNHEDCKTRYCRYVYSRHQLSCHALCHKWLTVCKQAVSQDDKKK